MSCFQLLFNNDADCYWYTQMIYEKLTIYTGFELPDRNSQFAKHFGSLQMNFRNFSKNCESLKSDTS